MSTRSKAIWTCSICSATVSLSLSSCDNCGAPSPGEKQANSFSPPTSPKCALKPALSLPVPTYQHSKSIKISTSNNGGPRQSRSNSNGYYPQNVNNNVHKSYHSQLPVTSSNTPYYGSSTYLPSMQPSSPSMTSYDALQQRLDIQQACIDSLTEKLQLTEKYASQIEEINNKLTMMMSKMNEFSKTINGKQMMLELTELKQKYDELSSKSTEKKEPSDNERLKIWLTDTVGLGNYYPIFIEHGFEDLDSVQHIDMDDLNEIGVDKLGHKKKILREAQKLKTEQKQQQIQHNVYPMMLQQLQYQQQQIQQQHQQHQQQQHVHPQPAPGQQANYPMPSWKCDGCDTLNVGNVIFCRLCGMKNQPEVFGQEVEGPLVYDTSSQ